MVEQWDNSQHPDNSQSKDTMNILEWPWRSSGKGNGQIVQFALCTVWVGGGKQNRGRKFAWKLYPNDATPDGIAQRLETVNERGGLELPDPNLHGTGYMKRTRFVNPWAAQNDIETIFRQMQTGNREMLMGQLCAGCETAYVLPTEQHCSKCKVKETLTDRFQEYTDDQPF